MEHMTVRFDINWEQEMVRMESIKHCGICGINMSQGRDGAFNCPKCRSTYRDTIYNEEFEPFTF